MIRFAIVALVACANIESNQPQTNFDLARTKAIQHGVRLPYANASEALIDTCCPLKPWKERPFEVVAACRELQRTVEAGGDAPSFTWGPQCREAIPTESLLISLRHPKRQDERASMVQRLAERDPDDKLQRALFQELLSLTMPSDDPAVSGVDDTSRILPRTLTVALAAGGEPELQFVAERLRSADSQERLWATHIFAYATSFPLDLPDALPLLEELARDPDRRIAERARHAANQYRLWATADLDAWAGRAADISVPSLDAKKRRYAPTNLLMEILLAQDLDQKLLAIQLFGRRRVFCQSTVATTVLAMLAKDGDPQISHLAQRAVLLRRERCGAR